jgi:hypothetical protein
MTNHHRSGLMREEGGGITPLSTSTEGLTEDHTEVTPAADLVRAPPSANIEDPVHSAQDLTQEKQALALLSVPSLAFNPHLRPTPESSLDHFTKALVIELRRFARSTGIKQRARQPEDRLRYNASLDALVCNLILAAVAGAQHLTLWLDTRSEVAKRWNGDCFGMPFRSAIDVMQAFGLMSLVQVGLRTTSGFSLPSRFAIGDAFKARWREQQQDRLLLDMSWITNTRASSQSDEEASTGYERPLLVLKGADGEAITFKETARTGEMRAQVARFNRILVHRHIHKIQGPLSLGTGRHRNRRGFIVDLTNGGETSAVPSV